MILTHIAGHLGQDPETRFTPKGQKVTTLRVATNIRRAKAEKTVWWRVTLWGEAFDRLLPYLKKGSAVYIVGELDIPETYQDREGNTQISLGVTASYVGFSPYGAPKSDRSSDQQGGGTQYNTPQQSQQEAESPYAFSQMSRGVAQGGA
jgi:single-strand DNA-binding protein